MQNSEPTAPPPPQPQLPPGRRRVNMLRAFGVSSFWAEKEKENGSVLLPTHVSAEAAAAAASTGYRGYHF